MGNDEVAIQQLLNRYCHELDRGDIAAVVEMFSDDAVLLPEYEGSGEHVGRAAIAAWYTRYRAATSQAVRGLRHKISTAMIQVDGDRATAVCYLDADAVDRTSGRRSLTGGRYEDELIRQGDRWRIRQRRIIIDYASTLPGA